MAPRKAFLTLAAFLTALIAATTGQTMKFQTFKYSPACGINPGAKWSVEGIAVSDGNAAFEASKIAIMTANNEELCTISMSGCQDKAPEEGCYCVGNSSNAILGIKRTAVLAESNEALTAVWKPANGTGDPIKQHVGNSPVVYVDLTLTITVNSKEMSVEPLANRTTITLEDPGKQNISFCAQNLVKPFNIIFRVNAMNELATNKGDDPCAYWTDQDISEIDFSGAYSLEYNEAGCERSRSIGLDFVNPHAATMGASGLTVSRLTCLLPLSILMMVLGAAL
ncbi:uncharacterized protein LOC101853018 [Aplysia californica]|uniref:Uncharacterized protein LOC101853018 n=1 Tax=Aplysia californica TaxID=6500 RepID=A0ABM0JY40_APLCA|nr:uncharacterized protein LOC101853018 [Aplysia californica]